MKRGTDVKTVRKMFVGLLVCGACAAACAGTVRTVTAPALTLDTRIGLVKVVEDTAPLRLSTRWDGAPEGVLTVNGAEAARLGADEEADHVLDGLAPGEYVCQWTTSASMNLATFCVRGGASALPPGGAGVRTATASPVVLDTRIGLVKVVEDAASLRLSTRWDGTEAGVLTVNGTEAARLGADEEADHVLDGLAPGEYVCQWTTSASMNLATFCVRGGASALPPGGAGVRTATAAAITLDTRIGLVKVVEDAAPLRLSTRWDGAPEGVLTVNGGEAVRLGADAEADHMLGGLAPGEYVCQWTTDASTNLATFCVRGGASILPPDGAGVRTATAASITLDTRIGLVKVVEGAAALRLSTRWDGAPEGVLTVNGAEAARLGADAEADHVLDGLAPGEYVCQWTTGASTNLATFCVRGGASALPPDGAGVRTATAAAIALDTRIGLVKVVEDAATLRLSTRWDGVSEGVLTVNGVAAARLGADAEADHVLDGLAPGEYVCQWTTGASTNLATFCVRGGASALPPDGVGVRTATAAPVALDTRIGLYKVLPVSDRGVASAVCRLSTRWDGAESGTLTVNGEEVRALGTSEEVDHRMDNLAPGEYVCRWTAGDAAYLATFSVRGDGSARPPRTGVEVTITGHTATYPYDGCEKRAGGFVVTTSDPLYTADDFVFTGNSNAVRTAVGTTAFGMSASDFANVNPDFVDVVFHVVDGSVTVTPGAVVNPFDPDDPSTPPAPGALARADCVTVYDGEGHTISVAPLLNPALAADGAAVTYSPDPSRVPFAPENPVFTNVVSTNVWYRIASPNYAPFTTNALLEIRPRPVTLTSGTKLDFVYDGQPHGFPVLGKSENGFVSGEGVTASNWATVTTVAEGEVDNTFDYAAQEGTDLANYAITVVTGKIAVVKAAPVTPGGPIDPLSPDPTDPSAPYSAYDFVGVYDGEAHTIDTNALRSVVYQPAAPLSFQYALVKDGALVDEPFTFTDVVSTSFWYRISAPNFADYWHEAKVTITNRPVTLTSGTKTDFVYNGTAHTCPHIMISGLGFVAGEGVTTSNWATVTAVAEGEVENTFDYAAQDGTDLSNYEITVITGRIAVVKATVGPGGGGEPGEGDVPDGGLSRFDAAFVYDGTGHTIDTNALVVAFGTAMIGAGAVEYAADDGSAGIGGRGAPDLPWGAVPAYTNAGEYVVWYRVTNPNYEDFVHAAKVTITKRPVTVRSRSQTKPYDGTPLRLTADDIDVTLTDGGQGLPALSAGESFVYGDLAERTAVGETEATFTVSAGANTLLANYTLTVEYGTLAVTKATYPGQEPGGARIAWSVAPGAATWMYDGRPHGVALTGVPAGVTARLAGNEAVDAGDYVATVTLDYDAANYEPPAAPAPLAWSIARRPLTLMAASREKPYDGFPLTVRPGDITASGSGYADGECLDYFGFASITDVGETAATFSYRDSATAKVANYDVTVAGGQTLKVTVGGDQISVTADSETWAYDGEEHRAATWRVGNGDKLLAGHELRVAIDPASVVRTPADGPDGDGVVSNRFASVRIVEAATGADRTRNYNLVLKEGVLRMTNACIRAEQVFGADDIAKVYDGVATQVVVAAELLQPARVRYFADGAAATSAALPEDAVWSGEPPSFTHATNATVRFTVEADYYNAYTGRVDVAIAKRAVTLTTPTKAKTYDGAPLTFGADEVELVATSATLPGGDGGHGVTALPDGESFVFSDFAAIADAGRVPARCAYVAGTGTRLSDYAVTEAWGTLTVLASADEITVTADSATWAYDGTAHRLPSYTAENADKLRPGDALDVAFAPESVVLTPEDGPDGDGVVSNAIASVRVLRHGTEDVTRNYSLAWHPGVLRVTKARMTFDGEGSVDPSGFSTTATYDGAGHTAAVVPPSLLTAPVTVRYYGAVATSATLPARGDGAVATSATLPARGDGAAATSAALPEEAAWSGEAPAFTNAGVHTVFYALDARHYETYFGTATVTIAPRPVTLVSDGAEKVYDGTPLRCGAVRVKDGSPGFVDGEGFAATCSGALTDVGAMENLFDYALTGGARAENYAVAKEYGWLRVTPATLDPGAVFGGGETDADGGPLCARVYNGAPQPFAPAPDFGEPYRLSYALVPGDESAYSETAPTRTHVAEGDLAVYFKFLSPNYAPYYGKGTLRIVPKALTEEMCVADEDAAWFFDGTEKRPAVTVVDGEPNIATADDYTLAYSGRTGAGLFPVTVTGTNDYCGVVTKEFAILKRPVAPPVIPSRAYSGRLQKPTIAADARWTVAANPGGTDAGSYTNVVLRLANTADYKWKGLGGDEADWTGVFEIRRGANGWSTYPGIRSWTNGVEAANEPTGRARFGTLSVAYRRRGAPVASETAERPSAPGRYTARFWVAESKNYAGVGLAAPYDVDFEIFRGPDDPPAGDATTTTPVPVPYAWLDAYVGRFGGGDYEAAAHAPGANGVALWESYVAGLDPADAASRFTASIALGADGTPVVTWSPDLRAAEPPRAYTVYGKPTLGAAAWTPVTDANRAAMRFFKVAVEVR